MEGQKICNFRSFMRHDVFGINNRCNHFSVIFFYFRNVSENGIWNLALKMLARSWQEGGIDGEYGENSPDKAPGQRTQLQPGRGFG